LDEATSSIDVRGERIVQKALEQVSQNRTTIVIAHRLSTIRKADKIIVMREGRKLEEGTHDSLLSDPNGVYAGLVHAQELEAESAPATIEGDEVMSMDVLDREITNASVTGPTDNETTSKRRGFFRSVGRLLYEQRAYWTFYVTVIVVAMAIGCKSNDSC
jgi:ATP-binding cassette, subfamily B (MDR/TAP), member 1